MRLIDADALTDWIEINPLTDDGGVDINELIEHINSMPTVRECKHLDLDKTYYGRKADRIAKEILADIVNMTANANDSIDSITAKIIFGDKLKDSLRKAVE